MLTTAWMYNPANRSDIQSFMRVLAVPEIRVDQRNHRPKDRGADLGLSRGAGSGEGVTGTEIVNRLLVRSALYISRV